MCRVDSILLPGLTLPANLVRVGLRARTNALTLTSLILILPTLCWPSQVVSLISFRLAFDVDLRGYYRPTKKQCH